MRRLILLSILIVILAIAVGMGFAATTVPTDIQQPGTQPGEVGNLETPDKCDNCHGGYNTSVEPAHNWRGSMMANAGRDPIFWATLAVAEQDFDGSGDLCIRCHSTAGWLAGRSTPTDGSGLMAGDADGVECDFCHKMTNPDNSELIGVQTYPFIANDKGSPAIGYYGSGISSIWGGNEKLGPYIDATARHQFIQSQFHRSVDYCGTCHDVSNPAVGDLAHNNGTQSTAGPVVASGVPGAPVTSKAAFNNFPYMYGIVERTFSEYKSADLVKTRVKDYLTLPSDLRGGAIKATYESAIVAGTGGDYEDGTPRYFSCQACHLRSVTGQGCNKNPAIRKDLPLHDMTGGNYWMPDAIQYLDSKGLLRLGGGLTAVQKAAMNDGKTRAMKQLSEAVSLTVNGNILKIVNQTGHKVISGYPEGRRMWLNIKWYDANNNLLREDGKYGPLVDGNGQPVTVTNPATGLSVQVNSILDLNDSDTKIYEAHYGMTQEWANQLLALGYSSSLPLSYNRDTDAVEFTLAQLAAQSSGTDHETFHFVLNNMVVTDNRIPPYKMSYDEARVRNALPVPATQYGSPTTGGFYNYWDEITLNPPPGAAYAAINMLYQPTSWEYIQFLYLANNGGNAFLANEGTNMLDAWLNNGMATPYVMATAIWETAPPPPCTPTEPTDVTCDGVDGDCDGPVDEDFIITPTSCGIGVCASAGHLECQSGTQVDTCTPGPQNESSDITCDGLDGDCDGTVDEDYIITPTSCGNGACASTGQLECQGGTELDSCTPGLPSSETCNNIDDNCDTSIDEGCDDDGDGYCDDTMTVAGAPVSECPSSVDGPGNDCNDTDLNIYPGGPAVRIVDIPPAYYSIFQVAYDNTATDGTLQSQDYEFVEVLLLDDDKSVTLQAGYDCSYTANTGKTIITGDMTINNGAVIIQSGTLEVR